MFRITDKPIAAQVPDCPSAGGFVTFEGRVRNLNDGQVVAALEYEAFSEMATAEGAALLEEAKLKFGLVWVAAIHRTGRVDLGEVAVWIGCGAPHRKEAFLACEFIIDELKRRLPIWKKEHYEDGSSEWVNLHQPARGAPITVSDVFSRQIAIAEIGAAGQLALRNARVLVVGAGGLSNAALPYLAGAGIGVIGVVEPDVLEASNLHRQTLFGYEDLGRSKAQLAAEAMRRIHPFSKVEAIEVRLAHENAERIIEKFDIVVDGTDRFDAKFVLNDACQKLGRPLVQASIYRTDGYVQTILPGGPCLRCQWEHEPVDGCVKTCAEAGVIGVVPGFFGILQATEVIKLITGFGEPLARHQLLADLRESTCQRIARCHRAGCSCQSFQPWKPKQIDMSWEVAAEDIGKWTKPFVCLDIREEDEPRVEVQLGQVEWRAAPMSRFRPEDELSGPQDVLLVCATGSRSGTLAFQLRDLGYEKVFSLRGGINACS